mgnify:CR=1 FL=1
MNKEKDQNSYHKINLNWYHGHLVQTQEDQYVNQQHFVE